MFNHNKINFKLVNFAILTLIVFLMYQTGHLWMGVFGKIYKIMLPFIFAFAIAYALSPGVEYLRKRKVPKALAIILVIIGMLAVLGVTFGLMFPLVFGQLSSLFNNILTFIKEISMNLDLNIGPLQQNLSEVFNDIIASLSKYVSDGAINFINVSMGVIGNLFIGFAATIYLMIDMEKIRAGVKKYFLRKSKKSYNYVRTLDVEMKNYLVGFVKIFFITIVEYTLVYYVIGHPNALLLGLVAAVSGLIPYFGGFIANTIAAITAFVISPTLFIWTCIAFAILSNVDGYLISPYIYGKTNRVKPLVSIFAICAGGILFGIMGIVISLPVTIILMTTLEFYYEAISEKIGEIKSGK